MIKRLFLLAASCLALAGVNKAWATVHNPNTEGDPRTSYVDKFTVPATSNMLLYANLKLSNVTGIKGDLWCYHQNQSIPWLFECEGPLEASANKEGVYNWKYDADAGTIKCEFQGKCAGSYMMTAIVTLTQGEDGKSVYAQVTKTAYPWNEK